MVTFCFLLPAMLIHADFSRRAAVLPDQYQWIRSPQGGVERVMLDRIGTEKARATSIVRYAPGSYFPAHFHPGGEEILVLSGTFSEDQCHYPAGSYLRSPPGSSHQPFSREGAVIFVKLRQMPPDERHNVRLDTHDPARWIRRAGGERCPLFTRHTEQVTLERIGPGQPLFEATVNGGAELLILEGGLREAATAYPRGSWLRFPADDCPALLAGPNGVTVYLKTGHLGAALGPHQAAEDLA